MAEALTLSEVLDDLLREIEKDRLFTQNLDAVRQYLADNRELLDALPDGAVRRLLEVAAYHIALDLEPAASTLGADEVNAMLAANAWRLEEFAAARARLEQFIRGLLDVAMRGTILAALRAISPA